MKKKEEKVQITFETEGNLHDEIVLMMQEIEKEAPNNPLITKYLFKFRQTFDLFNDIYSRNVTLLEKCQEMNTIVVTNASKIKAILDLTEKDKDSLAKLKEEYDDATKIVTASYDSETKAKLLLTSLREEVTKLSAQVLRGEAFSFGEEGSIFETSQDVQNLKKELEGGKKELSSIQSKVDASQELLDRHTKDISKLKAEEAKLEKQFNTLNTQFNELEAVSNSTYEEIVKLNPIIRKLQKTIEKNKKIKADKTAQYNNKKQGYYDILTGLTALNDESRALRDKITRRTRVKNELIHRNSLRQESVKDQEIIIKQKTTDAIEIHKKLDTMIAEGIELEKEVQGLYDNLKEISAKKVEARTIVKARRQELTDAAHSLIKLENNRDEMSRSVDAAMTAVIADKQATAEEAHATKEAASQAKTMKSETVAEKGRQQTMKEKILILFREIDEKRSEKFQTDAKTLIAKDMNTITLEQFHQHLQELEIYQSKTQHQVALSETLRDERNNYKRSLESLEKENAQIRAEYLELCERAKQMSDQIKKISRDTIDTHIQSQLTKEEIENYNDTCKQCRMGAQQTERVISRLQAESQTLSHIYLEAQHDRLQQNKEYNMAKNNFEKCRATIVERTQLMENLRGQIQTDENFIKKCASQYREKLDELATLQYEMNMHTAKTRELEERRERVKQLEYEEHKASVELLMERQKTVSLIHEFSVPRNVHRWNALEAVDPTYVKNLKYRMSLYIKLDEAHRTLEALKKERAELQAKVSHNQEAIDKALTHDQVQSYIKKYQAAIKEKTEKLREMSATASECHPSVTASCSKIGVIRTKVNQRKSAASVLHTTNIQNTAEQRGDPTAWFLTEAEAYPVTHGGGFVGVVPKGGRRQEEINGLSVVSQTPANTRPVSSLLSPTMGKITRPVSLSALRSPLHKY